MMFDATRHRLRWRRPVVVIGLAVPLLAGCSANEPMPDADTTGGNDGSSAAISQWAPGPLGEFEFRIFGIVRDPGRVVELAEAGDRQRREMEEAISVCMAAQGFEYEPVFTDLAPIFAQVPEIPLDSRAYAATYGFGMASGNEPGRPDNQPDYEAWPDPNRERLAAMSPAQQAAWDLALWGEEQLGDYWDPQLAGCAGRANVEFFPPQEVASQFAGLNDELNIVRNWISNLELFHGWQDINNPRLSETFMAWSSCMANAGYPGLVDMISVWQLIDDEWAALQNRHTGNRDGYLADFEEFRQWELAFAVAHWDCQQEVNWPQVRREVVLDLQQQFVDQHRDELEGWAQYMEEQRN